MQHRTLVLWSFLRGEFPPRLSKEECGYDAGMAVAQALFPGVKCYDGFNLGRLDRECIKPLLEKLFPDLLATPVEGIAADAMTEIAEFLPSDGYEWMDDGWKSRFDELLAA